MPFNENTNPAFGGIPIAGTGTPQKERYTIPLAYCTFSVIFRVELFLKNSAVY